MPYSVIDFKDVIRQHLTSRYGPGASVLDVGPGAGTYADLLRDHFPLMDAVEVWEPYLGEFGLRGKYREVFIGDVRTFGFGRRRYDVVILGDVLEHLPAGAARDVLARCRRHSREVIVSVPFLSEQGAWGGNPFETHHQPDLTPALVAERFPAACALGVNERIGVYTVPGDLGAPRDARRRILLCIPTYRRPAVIRDTLSHLLANLSSDAHRVTVAVGDNASTAETREAINSHYELARAAGIEFYVEAWPTNLGKAEALNRLQDTFVASDHDLVVTMDNDMRLSRNLLPLVDLCDRELPNGWEIAAPRCPGFAIDVPDYAGATIARTLEHAGHPCHVYPLVGVAGGLMVFRPAFLAAHRWTNSGGVYGEDDAVMSRHATSKWALYWEQPFVSHDPLTAARQDLALAEYHDRKVGLYARGVTVFPPGWDDPLPPGRA